MTLACGVWSIIVFLALNSTKDMSWLAAHRWGYYSTNDIFDGAWWSLITSAFVHLQLAHIFFNMYWLFILGPVLEREFGTLRFLGLVLGSAIASSGWQLATGDMGIGFSGVGYALAGFGWIAREHRPYLKGIFTDRTLQLFAFWGVLCIFLDIFKIMPIGNVAHIVGFGFGALAALVMFKKSALATFGAIVLFAAAFVPVYWCPKSEAWVYVQGTRAMENRDYNRAIPPLKRSLEMGYNSSEVWFSLAGIYGYQRKSDEYRDALKQLGRVGPSYVKEVTDQYGDPDSATWLTKDANDAAVRGDYEKAITFYKLSLAKGEDPILVWRALTEIYRIQEKHKEFLDAVKRLRAIDPMAAEESLKDFGKPRGK